MDGKPQIVLLGGGGHCRSVIDAIEQENKFRINGIIDNNLPLNHNILSYKVIGVDEDIAELVKDDVYFLITVGQIKSYAVRFKLAELLTKYGARIASVISPQAYISRHAWIGKGSVILNNAMINANVEIGNHCIINTKALVEHDSVIGDFCHISTGAIVNGNCTLENGCFVGSNATISNGKVIPKESVIGAGMFYK